MKNIYSENYSFLHTKNAPSPSMESIHVFDIQEVFAFYFSPFISLSESNTSPYVIPVCSLSEPSLLDGPSMLSTSHPSGFSAAKPSHTSALRQEYVCSVTPPVPMRDTEVSHAQAMHLGSHSFLKKYAQTYSTFSSISTWKNNTDISQVHWGLGFETALIGQGEKTLCPTINQTT